MPQKDISKTVNSFMLSNAPTLAEATPMGYAILKVIAAELVLVLGTTKEHALYVMMRKYGHIYATSCISAIINEGLTEEADRRLKLKRDLKGRRLMASHQVQPILLSA